MGEALRNSAATHGFCVFALMQASNSQWTAYFDGSSPQFATHSTVVLTYQDWQDHVKLNAWNQIRVVFKRDANNAFQTIVYIKNADGVYSKTVSTPWPTGTPKSGDWTLHIGNFDGDVDEVRISSTDRGSDLTQ